jgi:hypothetical protein
VVEKEREGAALDGSWDGLGTRVRRRTIDNAVCLCTSWRCICTPTICSMGACSWSAHALLTTHLVQSSSYLLTMAGINLKHDSLPQERTQPGQSSAQLTFLFFLLLPTFHATCSRHHERCTTGSIGKRFSTSSSTASSPMSPTRSTCQQW